MNTLTGSNIATVIADGKVLERGTVESMEPESVIEAAENARERLQHTTGWSTSVAGSSPPGTSIARQIAARPALRVLKQYGQEILSEKITVDVADISDPLDTTAVYFHLFENIDTSS